MDSQVTVEEKFQQLLDQMAVEEHPQALLDGMEILFKLLDNIGKNPLEQKFRRIKTTNAKLSSTLFVLANINQLLATAGFQRNGDDWVLPDQNLGNALRSISELKMFTDLLRANITSPEEYQRVLTIQQAQKETKRKEDEEKRKADQVKQTLDYDRQERKYIKANKGSSPQVITQNRQKNNEIYQLLRKENLEETPSHLKTQELISIAKREDEDDRARSWLILGQPVLLALQKHEF